jgi:hypothetical protein
MLLNYSPFETDLQIYSCRHNERNFNTCKYTKGLFQIIHELTVYILYYKVYIYFCVIIHILKKDNFVSTDPDPVPSVWILIRRHRPYGASITVKSTMHADHRHETII